MGRSTRALPSIIIGPAVVGGLFIYLPGRALVSSVIYGLNNAPVSSLARGLQALVTAGILALGMLVGSRIGIGAGLGLDYQPDVSSTPLILSVSGILLGILGIAIAWSTPPMQLAPTLAMSVVAWLIVALPDLRGEGSGWWAHFIGAMVVGGAGVVVGAMQRSPQVPIPASPSSRSSRAFRCTPGCWHGAGERVRRHRARSRMPR